MNNEALYLWLHGKMFQNDGLRLDRGCPGGR